MNVIKVDVLGGRIYHAWVVVYMRMEYGGYCKEYK